ncbi:MAG: 50S ribosomal protein L4 [Candidatus Paceibacterota bacterium]
MKADLFNQKNEKIGTVDLPDNIFGVKWNPDLVHQVLTVQVANRRRTLADTKDRGEVSGGGRKPWRQKGTGRSRQGSTRSPLWKGGGVTFGPLKERNFSKGINQKMKQSAVSGIFSKKLAEQDIKFIDTLNLKDRKTKNLAELLKKFVSSKESVLLIPSVENKNIYPAGRNLPKVGILSPESLNVYDLLKYQKIILDQGAIASIAKHYKA